MDRKRKFEFNTASLAELPGYEVYTHKNYDIYDVSSLDNPRDNTLMYCTHWLEEIQLSIGHVRGSIIILPETVNHILNEIAENNLCIISISPRKDYAIILRHILERNKKKSVLHHLGENIYVGDDVSMGKNVVLEPGVFIESHVEIGDNCVIGCGSKLDQYVSLGKGTMIGAHCVIGGGGFGFERGEGHEVFRVPQIGGVKIGSYAEIGALCTVSSGTMEPTVIEDYVKIDDQVHIGHNSSIGKGTIIAGFTMICGSVAIGSDVWLGPGCTISDHVKIGDGAQVGIGSILIESIKEKSSTGGYYALDRKTSLKHYQRLKNP